MVSSTLDIAVIWERIESVLREYAPATAATLAAPATATEIADLEIATGLRLPDDFRRSLKIHNGQFDPTRLHRFIHEGVLADTTQIAETWKMLTELDECFREREPNWDTHGHGQWWSCYWVPFSEGDGDNLCINLDAVSATFGEIVCHIHDNPHESGIAANYTEWLDQIAADLENHEFTIDEQGYLWPNMP